MSLREVEDASRTEDMSDPRLLDYYKALNPHLRAALLHARAPERRDRPEPCGGDSDMD